MIAKMYFDIAHLRFEIKDIDCFVYDKFLKKNALFLSNNDEKRKKYCFGKLVSEYGRSMHNYIPQSVFGFCEFNILELPFNLTNRGIISSEYFYEGYNKEFLYRASFLDVLLTFLWFIKDNSVGIYGTYGQIPDVRIVNGKSRSIINYTCKGEIENVNFSEQELKYAANLVSKYSSICGLSRKIIDDTHMLWEYDEQGNYAKAIIPKTHERFNYKDQNAIDRAIHFLIIARGQNYLMYRVAYYMPILECLFSTKDADITFLIAARTAVYIGKSRKERLEIFKNVRLGYNVRSRFIHGQELDKSDQSDLMELSVSIDDYIRRVLTKVIKKDSLIFSKYDTTERDEYLNSRVVNFPFDTKAVKERIKVRDRERERAKNKELDKQIKREAHQKREAENKLKRDAHNKENA